MEEEFMTTKEACELWDISQRQVRFYCKEGFVFGATQEKNGKWLIPDGSIRPFYFNPKKAAEQAGRKVLILQAISKEQTIPDDRISRIAGRVDDLFAELSAQELIQRVQNINGCDDKYVTHILTEKGEQLLKQNGTFERIVAGINRLPPIQVHFHLPQAPT